MDTEGRRTAPAHRVVWEPGSKREKGEGGGREGKVRQEKERGVQGPDTNRSM